MKIVIGLILGVVITQFGIVPIAKFIDRTFHSGAHLVQVVVKSSHAKN